MAESLDLVTPYFPVYAPFERRGATPSEILDHTISAILGGNSPILEPGEEWPRCAQCDSHLIPYIQINVSCHHTPEEFRNKLAAELHPGQAMVFQVLVCAEDESVACFDETVVSDPEGGAWHVRVLHAPTVDTDAVEKMRSDMSPDKFFINERVLTHWTPGRSEVEHKEVNWEIDEELYEQHKPTWGLKLLGWPVRGKYYTSHEECSVAQADETAHSDWRCLIQLGTGEPYSPEMSEASPVPLESVGNTFINQCVQHPGEFAMSISGDW
ncbi:hypothetical protein V8D89_003830 [Ganoderma adspersum]